MEIIKFYDSKKEYGEFSNFYQHRKGREIVFNNKIYPTSEHLYQALKYDYEGASEKSLEYAELIRTSSTAYKAKIIANQMILNRYNWQKKLNPIIQEYLDNGLDIREDWDDVIDDTMLKVLRLKFNQDLHCQRVLLGTGDAQLVEHTTRDAYWASGPDGKGLNMLGKLLCKVRDEIRLKNALSPLKDVRKYVFKKEERKLDEVEDNDDYKEKKENLQPTVSNKHRNNEKDKEVNVSQAKKRKIEVYDSDNHGVDSINQNTTAFTNKKQKILTQ